LRLGCPHASRHQPQALRAFLHFNNRAHQVVLNASKLQNASPVLLVHCIVRSTHVEHNASIF
jgi:hypothetical protein